MSVVVSVRNKHYLTLYYNITHQESEQFKKISEIKVGGVSSFTNGSHLQFDYGAKTRQ